MKTRDLGKILQSFYTNTFEKWNWKVKQNLSWVKATILWNSIYKLNDFLWECFWLKRFAPLILSYVAGMALYSSTRVIISIPLYLNIDIEVLFSLCETHTVIKCGFKISYKTINIITHKTHPKLSLFCMHIHFCLFQFNQKGQAISNGFFLCFQFTSLNGFNFSNCLN